jgi:hypothetical protein
VSHGDDRVGIVGPFAFYRREPLAAAGEAIDDRAGAIRFLVQEERECAPEPSAADSTASNGANSGTATASRSAACPASGGSRRTPRTGECTHHLGLVVGIRVVPTGIAARNAARLLRREAHLGLLARRMDLDRQCLGRRNDLHQKGQLCPEPRDNVRAKQLLGAGGDDRGEVASGADDRGWTAGVRAEPQLCGGCPVGGRPSSWGMAVGDPHE